MLIRALNEASSSAPTEISPDDPTALHPEQPFHACCYQPPSLKRGTAQSKEQIKVIALRSFLRISERADSAIAISHVARRCMTAVASNVFHSWY